MTTRTLVCVLCGGLFSLGALDAQAARVEIVIAQQNASPADQQTWYQLFTELKVDGLQIRAATPTDVPALVSTPLAGDTLHRVTGVLTARGELHVPGSRLSRRDRAGVSAWLAGIRAQAVPGAPVAPTATTALSLQDRAEIRRQLAPAVGHTTRGQALKELLDQTANKLKLPLVGDDRALVAVRGAEPILDELQDVSLGTALAAALRPAGLVLVPRRNMQGKIELLVTHPTAGAEHWPIGWPPSVDKPERELLPEMFELVNVELDDVALSELIAAVAARVKVAVLTDHNGLARQSIDPSQVRVSLPAKKSAYAVVLVQMLAKARLKYETRVDDAGRPFFWIYSLL